jgi:bifunctional ADP-heptose synthase (sugar kinase/adenylyltransferase)|tara:strand:- start:43 stop:789 length:747 start_codon:yes stop_codon:yes gene_type:complete
MSRVLLIGESCMDIFIYGNTPRLSPEGPAPVFNPINERYNGGMALNVQSNLESLDVSVDIITHTSTITKTRYVHESSNTLLLRVDEGDFVDRIDKTKLPTNYWDYDMVVISDYNKGFLTNDDIAHIAFNHPNTICDTKKKLGEWCRDLKFIKLNRTEYLNNETFINDNEWVIEKLIITLDKEGCKHKDVMYPTKEVEIMDISGAGDTFVAGFTMKYIESSDVNESIKFGNDCASQVVQKRGVTIITKT